MATTTALIELACLMEATARKPGNVHPGASFSDLCYDDFVKGAAAIAPIIALAGRRGIGRTVLMAIEATRDQVASNLNLGIVLLLAPLAAVPRSVGMNEHIGAVMQKTTQQDAALVYQAIRLAHPGGLGKVDDQDVADIPTQNLVEVMRLAADRDLIAAQYVTDFKLVRSQAEGMFGSICGYRNALRHRREPPPDIPHGPPLPLWEWAIVYTFVGLMAKHPDSLIARKCGMEVALEAQRRAAEVMAAKWPATTIGWQRFLKLDKWLRADGHRRNPGTSADLMAATIFVLLRQGWLEPPKKADVLAHAEAIRARVFAPRH